MKSIGLCDEKVMVAITGYLTALETLVRHRNALKLYDVNQHCEDVYGDLLNVVLNSRCRRLRLHSANTSEHPNFAGVDLIDEKRRVIVQVSSTSSNKKVRHTFFEINKQKRYEGYTLYFMFIAGKSEKIDLRKNRPPKFIICKREHLLYPEDLTALLQGSTSRTRQRVLEILKYHLGNDEQKVSAEQCLCFVNKIAGLVKSTDHVRCMCNEYLQSGLGIKGCGLHLLHRINHQVSKRIPDRLPDLEPFRHVWARNMEIYSFLLEIGRLVVEVNSTGKDDISYLDVLEVKKLTEALLIEIYRVIRCMSKVADINEEVAFTELTIKANDY